jgi:hypothetical protein
MIIFICLLGFVILTFFGDSFNSPMFTEQYNHRRLYIRLCIMLIFLFQGDLVLVMKLSMSHFWSFSYVDLALVMKLSVSHFWSFSSVSQVCALLEANQPAAGHVHSGQEEPCHNDQNSVDRSGNIHPGEYYYYTVIMCSLIRSCIWFSFFICAHCCWLQDLLCLESPL